MIEDSELLRRYAENRSEAAFSELVRRRVNLVYSVALRQVGGDTHLAEDVTQNVFIDLARKAGSLLGRPVLSGWLYRSAQFAGTDVVRSERRRRAREEERHIMDEPPINSGEEAADWEKLRPVLDQAMGELDDDDRDAVALRFFEERSFADIGRRLSLSEEAARKRVSRAIDKLHGSIARRGVTSTTAALAVAMANQVGVAAPAGLAATITGTVLALGAGGGSAVGLLGILNFMSMMKIVVSVAVVVAVAGTIALSVAPSAQPTAAVEAFAAPRATGPALDSAKTPASTAPMVAAAAAVIESTDARASEGNESPVPAAPTAKQTRQAAKQADRREAKQEANEANRAAKTRAGTIRRLAPLFQQLTLSPEQQEQLVVLVTNQHESTIDLAAANAKQGVDISADADAYWSGKRQLNEEFQSRVKALLGDAGYEAFLANDLVIAQSAVVEHMQTRLKAGGAQLSEAQAAQLLALVKERATPRVDDYVLRQASGFLSALQMDALKIESMRQMEGPLKPAVQKVIDRNLGGKTPPAKK